MLVKEWVLGEEEDCCWGGCVEEERGREVRRSRRTWFAKRA